MLSQFINYLLSKAEYLKDENNIIIAKVPNFQGFYSQ